MKHKTLRHFFHWFFLGLLLLSAVFLVEMKGDYFLASVIQIEPQHQPYDGVEMPIKKVPDWVSTSETERNLSYSNFPLGKLIDLPNYDLQALQTVTDGLDWDNPVYNTIRNIQITYPVLYSGTYTLDGIEGTGSHPAVDIKALRGTPVYAIGNGRVVKVAKQDNGFGQHVVILHSDFPSFEDSNIKEDIYSSYSHLDSIMVTEGQIVSRGQKIGEVGSTGFATTSHLHFQIDKDTAPWYPYWPFTYTDIATAGLSFLDAINVGFQKNNIPFYTIHPIQYVLQYATSVPPATVTIVEIPAENTSENPSTVSEDVAENVLDNVVEDTLEPSVDNLDTTEPEVLDEPVEEVLEEPILEEPVPTNIFDIAFIHNTLLLANKNYIINIEALDEHGNRIKEPQFQSLTVRLSNDLGEISNDSISTEEFYGGKTGFAFSPNAVGQTQVILELDNALIFRSQPVDVREKFEDVASFAFEHDGNFEPGIAETVRVLLFDKDKNITPLYTLSQNVEVRIDSGKGILTPQQIGKSHFREGVAELRFVPESSDNVIFSINRLGVSGKSEPLVYRVFQDVASYHKQFKAIRFLKEKQVVEGYEDGTFRPLQKVTRAEALKMIFATTQKNIVSRVSLPFSDVQPSQWFHDYVATAYDAQIVRGYTDGTFRPENLVSKVEFLKILFSALEIDIDPLVLQDPYDDVPKTAWFAPYVQYAKNKSLLPSTENSIDPNKMLTRAEVADFLYRLATLGAL